MKSALLAPVLWLDRNLERTVILVAYTACAGIIATEVVRRFLFDQQVSWSTTIPAYMFVWLTWPGAAYGVKIRAHLAFSEFRAKLSRPIQYILLQIDYVLFLIFGCVAVYYSYELLLVQQNNFSTVPGTITVPAWWFYLATPVGWTMLMSRVLQNAVQDLVAMRTGQPLNIGGGITAID